MVESCSKRLAASPETMPESGIGCLAYLADLIANLETGIWIANCPQAMSRAPRRSQD